MIKEIVAKAQSEANEQAKGTLAKAKKEAEAQASWIKELAINEARELRKQILDKEKYNAPWEAKPIRADMLASAREDADVEKIKASVEAD